MSQTHPRTLKFCCFLHIPYSIQAAAHLPSRWPLLPKPCLLFLLLACPTPHSGHSMSQTGLGGKPPQVPTLFWSPHGHCMHHGVLGVSEALFSHATFLLDIFCWLFICSKTMKTTFFIWVKTPHLCHVLIWPSLSSQLYFLLLLF